MAEPLAFVTGGTGFVGGQLLSALVRQGFDVVCLRRGDSRDEPGVRYVRGDVTDLASVLAGLPGHCDAVFHVAANIAHWRGANREQDRVNILGTRNVARAALARGARRLIHCSSDAVWGLKTPLLREDAPRRAAVEPGNYHRSKFWAEEEIRCAINAGLDAVMINPTNILGPGDLHGWSSFAVGIDRGSMTAAPPGSGAFVHVADVVQALIVGAERGRCGHNYLLGSANASYLQLAQACARRLGKSIADEPQTAATLLASARQLEALAEETGKAPSLSLDTARVLCANLQVDSTKAVAELGFALRPLQEMVDDAIDWLISVGKIQSAMNRS